MEKEIKTREFQCQACNHCFKIKYTEEMFGKNVGPCWIAQGDDEHCPECDSWLVS